MGALICQYYQASGTSLDSCVFLGKRFDEDTGPRAFDSDYWLVDARRMQDGQISVEIRLDSIDYLPALWKSETGRTYVLDPSRRRMMYSDDTKRSEMWRYEQLPITPIGIWAMSETCFFVWGQRPTPTGTNEHPILFRDGQGFREIPNPGVQLLAMHGLSPELVYAVGVRGYVGRWDGSRWQQFVVPTTELLTSVFVASPDEIYAVGIQGNLLEGSSHGWGKVAVSPWGGDIPFQSVAKFQDRLLLAGGPAGLLLRPERTHHVEEYHPEVLARSFEIRGDFMLVTAENAIATTTDAEAFEAIGHGYVSDVTSNIELRRSGR